MVPDGVKIKNYLMNKFKNDFKNGKELELFLAHEFRYFFIHQYVKNKMNNLLRLINKLGISFKSVLDVGCGSGEVVELFNDQNLLSVGVDLQKNVLIKSSDVFKKFYNKKLNFIVCNVNFLPFEENTFDLIILLDVIEHVNNLDLLMSSLKRTIKKEGHIIICFPPYNSIFGAHMSIPYAQVLPHFIKKHFFNQFKYRDYYLNKITVSKFEHLVNSHGFDIKFKNMYTYNNFLRRNKVLNLFSKLPFLREILFSYCYVLRAVD